MGRGRSVPSGIEIRGKSLRLTFTYRGVRCRETVKLPPTPANIRHAERWRATIQHEIALGTFNYSKHFPESAMVLQFRPGAATPISRALESWLMAMQKTTAYSTWQDYSYTVRRHLVPKFGGLRLTELTTAMVKEWIGGLSCGPKRVNNMLIPLRGVFADAYGDNLVERDPMARVRNLRRDRAPEPDPLSPTEIAAVLNNCDGQIRNFWQFAFSTGLRTGEQIALQWGDVDWLHSTVRVRRAIVRGQERGGTKTESGVRDVKLLPMALAALQAQKQHTFMAGEWIFHNPRHGAHWTGPKALSKGPWAVVLRKAKVRYRNLYQTRHSYASMLLTAGEDPMWVAQQMGHKDWGMLRKIYGRWIPSMRPDAGQKASKLIDDIMSSGAPAGQSETTVDGLGQPGKSSCIEKQPILRLKWRSGRDSNQ